MFSTHDPSSSSVTTLSEKVLHVTCENASSVAGGEEAIPGHLASQAPKTKHGTVASVCVVAACTSSLMMSVALGPSVSVLLPYASKDLHIQQVDLQWIVNAYSLSSVINFKHK